MRPGCRRAAAGAMALPMLLVSGCLFTTRRLPVPKPPSMVQTVAPEELVAQLNQRWDALQSLNATVEIQASVLKSKVGRGHGLYHHPGHHPDCASRRCCGCCGRVPVLGTPMFDMASDGKNFTL